MLLSRSLTYGLRDYALQVSFPHTREQRPAQSSLFRSISLSTVCLYVRHTARDTHLRNGKQVVELRVTALIEAYDLAVENSAVDTKARTDIVRQIGPGTKTIAVPRDECAWALTCASARKPSYFSSNRKWRSSKGSARR